jgi:hypothetical protein
VYPPLGGLLFLAGNPYDILCIYILPSFLVVINTEKQAKVGRCVEHPKVYKGVAKITPLNPKSLPP